MDISSTSIKDGKRLPDRLALDFQNQSPDLTWTGVPEDTRELVLVCEDPDAPMGTWVHWLLYGIPPAIDHLNAGIPKGHTLRDLGGAMQGKNDFGNIGYDGPRPPKGPQHRYYFRLYALNAPLNLRPGATARELRKAMEGKVIAQAEIMGTYSR